MVRGIRPDSPIWEPQLPVTPVSKDVAPLHRHTCRHSIDAYLKMFLVFNNKKQNGWCGDTHLWPQLLKEGHRFRQELIKKKLQKLQDTCYFCKAWSAVPIKGRQEGWKDGSAVRGTCSCSISSIHITTHSKQGADSFWSCLISVWAVSALSAQHRWGKYIRTYKQ